MLLSDLAAALATTTSSDVEVRHVTHNSRWVEPGDAYVALKGVNHDGHEFIDDAVSRGAVAVIGEGLPEGVACPVPYLTVEHGRRALAAGAAAVNGNPSRELFIAGVTGTDGKTTTSLMTRHLLRAAGLPTGLVSTVGYELPDGVLRQPPVHFTTPEAPQVQEILAQVLADGGGAAVVESSSHALALERVGSIDFDVAIWTQLTSEHLDFHGTVENYFADKRKLVERAQFAMLNADDPWTAQLRGIAPGEWTYSAEGNDADWRATNVAEHAHSLTFNVDSPLGAFDVDLPMIGRFNVANILAAMGGAARAGATVEQLVEGARTFGGVPGRMQLITVEGVTDAPRVIVDFAHTPPSLEKALATVRATTERELWVVLGSAGGNRDPKKRYPLGETATRLAEHAVFTEEDHRWTPLQDILDEMGRGAGEAGRTNYDKIGDRTQAIRHAVATAQPGDTVVLAGKGPEETMERGHDFYPWDEVGEARNALKARAGLPLDALPTAVIPHD